MSKRPPEFTWQDKAILVVIPVVVVAIFIAANYFSKDLTVADAFAQQLNKVQVRDSGFITEITPPDPLATATQKCRLKGRESGQEFTFLFNVQGSQTLPLQIGRLVQFFGEYTHDPQGGKIEVPYKGKSGRWSGWAVYENRRYFHADETQHDL